MMLARFILLFVFTLLAGSSFAQSSKKKKDAEESDLQQPNSFDPNYQPTERSKKKSKSQTTVKPSRSPDKEFYERMAQIEKTRQKNERMMDKPQYSDPMYFGHKKPPKKHKPSKMKYCKVCGIRH